jgi:hypothetical protein
MLQLFPTEDPPMNAEELEKFKLLLEAYEQALRLQRIREKTIETCRQNLWKEADRLQVLLDGFVLRWEDQL